MLIVDLSSNQGSVDFHALRRAGVGAVWLKATEGLTWRDPDFKERRGEANAAGLRVGAYGFARPDLHPRDPESEALHFCATVGELGRRDLRPALDLEVTHVDWGHVGDWARRWSRTVRNHLGCYPVFYSYPAWIDDAQLGVPIGAGLWLASYDRNDGQEHPYRVPRPWRRAVAHQFTSNARLAGIPGRVDLSSASKLRPLLAHPYAGLL